MSSATPGLRFRFRVISLLCLVLTACGGGGGGEEPDTPSDVGVSSGDAAELLLRSSNEQGLALSLKLPQVTAEEVLRDGKPFLRLRARGMESLGGAPGAPAVPMLRRLIALPRGAKASLARAVPTRGEAFRGVVTHVDMASFEASPRVDEWHKRDAPPPAELYKGELVPPDPIIYDGAKAYPHAPAAVIPLGSVRGLQLAVVEMAAGEYDPVAKTFTPYTSMDVQIAFKGGGEGFVDQRFMSAFEAASKTVLGQVVNKDAVLNGVTHKKFDFVHVGEELMILTTPELKPAADELAKWKNERGLLTRVFVVGDGEGPAPDTPEAIDQMIEAHWDQVFIRPSYMLIFGDDPAIPTWQIQRLIKDPGVLMATDFPYSKMGPSYLGLDFYADVALGRIPVDTLSEAWDAVSRIQAYESGLLVKPYLTTGATIAAYFQCCRSGEGAPGRENGRDFIRRAEYARNILNAANVGAERIYNTSTHYHSEYTDDPTPRAHANGDLLPSAIDAQSGFAWDGDTQDILDAFNEGRRLIMHFDHGWSQGWGDPYFSTGHFGQLVNADALPVVVNMNCSTGRFDGVEGFAEQLIDRPVGGAIGVYGWTRMSNSMFVRRSIMGFFGGLYPHLVPEAAAAQPLRRLGDLLMHGRDHMATAFIQSNPSSQTLLNTVNHVRLYHLLGDPTLEIRMGKAAITDLLVNEYEYDPKPDFTIVYYGIEEATITMMQHRRDGWVPIGRGQVKDGKATLPHLMSPGDGPVSFFASLPEAGAVVLGR